MLIIPLNIMSLETYVTWQMQQDNTGDDKEPEKPKKKKSSKSDAKVN